MVTESEQVNKVIETHSKAVFSLLSKRGKRLAYPKKGILAQSAEAREKRYDATIGIALDDEHKPLSLKSVQSRIDVLPGEAFPYAPSFGKKELREKWKTLIEKKNPSLKETLLSTPIVTNGLTHGLHLIGNLFVEEGEKVIIPSPYWGNYRLIFEEMAGGVLDPFPLFKEDKLNEEGLKEKVEGEEKKVVLLTFPHNPTGYFISKEEEEELVEILKSAAEKSPLLVILDDAYFGLFYEDKTRESLFAKLASLHENLLAIKIDGATKEDFSWGLRVGFVTVAVKEGSKELYDALELKLAAAVRGSISSSSHLSQTLLFDAISKEGYDKDKEEKYNLLRERYEEVKNVLEDKKYQEYFSPLPFNAGYFMCLKLKEGLDAEEVRQILLEKYDTGVIQMKNLLRVTFSSIPKKDVKTVFDNIYATCKELSLKQ